MKGTVDFRNPLKGRYALRMESGFYSAFQLISTGIVFDLGEELRDGLDETGVQTVHAEKHGNVNVFVELARCSRAAAETWVKNAG